MIVILHDIRSMHNVGSILRTADAIGIEKVYLTGYTPSPIDLFGRFRKQIQKVSLGAEKNVVWEKHQNVLTLIKNLQEQGIKVYSVEQHSTSEDIRSWKADWEKSAIVLGNEVDGLNEKIIKASDGVYEIPMYGKKESLNVSVAFGVAAYLINYITNKN